MRVRFISFTLILLLTFGLFSSILSNSASAITDQVFVNGGQVTPVAISFIKKAKVTLDIEIYEMSDPQFLQALLEAQKKGVKLRIIKDPTPFDNAQDGEATTVCHWFDPPTTQEPSKCAVQRKFMTASLALGAKIVPFNKLNLCDKDEGIANPNWTKGQCFEHGKMMIADQKLALISTGNFNEANLCDQKYKSARCNRDFTAITQDAEVLNTLQNIYDHDFLGNRYQVKPVVIGSINQKLTVSPYSADPLIAFINSATKSIRVYNQYMYHYDINSALANAAKRGVKVQMVLASLCAFEKPDAVSAEKTTKLMSFFDANKIEARFFTDLMKVGGRAGYNHAKAILVDGTKAWVGSVNGSNSGVDRNREFGLFIQDSPSIKKLNALFDLDFASPNSESWQESLQCTKDNPGQ